MHFEQILKVISVDGITRADQVSDLQRGLQDICPTLFQMVDAGCGWEEGQVLVVVDYKYCKLMVQVFGSVHVLELQH